MVKSALKPEAYISVPDLTFCGMNITLPLKGTQTSQPGFESADKKTISLKKIIIIITYNNNKMNLQNIANYSNSPTIYCFSIRFLFENFRG